jgi:hypothetical protein
MMGALVLQPAVGWMLDRRFGGGVEGGVRVYELSAYRAGFVFMMAWVVISLIAILFTRETHCRQQGPGDPRRGEGSGPADPPPSSSARRVRQRP